MDKTLVFLAEKHLSELTKLMIEKYKKEHEMQVELESEE